MDTTKFIIMTGIITHICINISAENVDSLHFTVAEDKSSFYAVLEDLLAKNAAFEKIRDVYPEEILPQKDIDDIFAQFKSSRDNEDVHLNISQLIQKYGYNVESYDVETRDGYILTMFRIPRNGSAVLLMHGLLESSDDFVTAGPVSGIAYLLSDQGFDVWMGNARGNKHSRRHTHLSPEQQQFWDFSWDEIGRYDLPAMIDHVLANSGRDQLRYVGHSQGTTAFFVLGAERPEYNAKISLMVALSAVAWMSHAYSPVIRFLATYNSFLTSMAETLGIYELFPDSRTLNILKSFFCGKKQLAELYCNNFLFVLCGFNFAQVNVSNLPVIFGHLPSGAAAKQVMHYAQVILSGNFQNYDHGAQKNRVVYGSNYPPVYSVEKITAPVAIFYSEGDWISSVEDVVILRNKLPNVVDFYKIPLKNFNHVDFLWAKDVKKIVFYRLIHLFKTIK